MSRLPCWIGICRKPSGLSARNAARAWTGRERYYLTHNYWREGSVEFFTAEGRAKVRDELMVFAKEFGQLDRDIENAAKPMRQHLGVNDRVIDECTARQMARLEAGLPWEEKSPPTRNE